MRDGSQNGGSVRRTSHVRAEFRLPAEIAGEVDSAVAALEGPPWHMNRSLFAAEALKREVLRLRQKFNHGDEFPTRQAPCRDGFVVK